MPRTEAANQRLRDAQRAKILASARTAFARKGLTATMADVAAAAGVSQGLAYRYFASKEALFQALAEHVLHAGVTGLQRLADLPGTPGERLDVLVARVIDDRRVQPEFYQLFYHVLGDEATPDRLRELVGQQGRAYRDLMRRLIVEGQATGEVVAGDPDQLVSAVLACLEGLSRLAAREPDQVARHFPDAAIILRMLKP